MRLKRQHSLIIGGTRGIGGALARRWACQGHCVSIVGRHTPVRSDKVPSAAYWSVDLTRPKQLAKFLDDIVVKRGAINHLVFFQRFRGGRNVWHGELETTLTATKNIVDGLHHRLALGVGQAASIVMVISVASEYIAEEQPLGYHVAKAGLLNMMRYYAVKLGPMGIRVNAVSFGAVIKAESRAFYDEHPSLAALYGSMSPLGRMGTADDIIEAVDFLSGGKSAFVTGQNLVVDGGVSLQWHGALARKIASRKDE